MKFGIDLGEVIVNGRHIVSWHGGDHDGTVQSVPSGEAQIKGLSIGLEMSPEEAVALARETGIQLKEMLPFLKDMARMVMEMKANNRNNVNQRRDNHHHDHR